MRVFDVLNESNVKLRKSESIFSGRLENENVSNILRIFWSTFTFLLFSDLLYVFSKTRMFLGAFTYFRFVGSTLRISRKGYC